MFGFEHFGGGGRALNSVYYNVQSHVLSYSAVPYSYGEGGGKFSLVNTFCIVVSRSGLEQTGCCCRWPDYTGQ